MTMCVQCHKRVAVVFVTKIENGELYVCAHSNDAKNKRLNDYFFKELLPLHIVGVEI